MSSFDCVGEYVHLLTAYFMLNAKFDPKQVMKSGFGKQC